MIRWWSHVQDLRIASTRIRGELVMRGLRRIGVQAEWFDPGSISECSTLVLGKRYDDKTRAFVIALKKRNARVVLDLCDNRFVAPGSDASLRRHAEQLRRLVPEVDCVVAASEALAEVVRTECPGVRDLRVIGDLQDDLSVVPQSAIQRLRTWWELRNGLKKVAGFKGEGRTALVWFGSHGGPYDDNGMGDLGKLRTRLEHLNLRRPLFLSIVSNSAEKYARLFSEWQFPTLYFEWETGSFRELLAAHQIALIPVTDSPFTRCKTDNRVVTALTAGLAVVADPIPSYLRYASTISLGNWDEGLEAYMENATLRSRHVSAGAEMARLFSAPRPILEQWRRVLAA